MPDEENRERLMVIACFKGFPDVLETARSPHLTLVPAMFIEEGRIADMLPSIRSIISSIPQFEAVITKWHLLGKRNDTHAWEVYGIFGDGSITSIEGLHHKLLKEFAHLGVDIHAKFNRDKFIPHITDRQVRFKVGDIFQVNKILVLKKLPLGNYELLFEKVFDEDSKEKCCNGLVV